MVRGKDTVHTWDRVSAGMSMAKVNRTNPNNLTWRYMLARRNGMKREWPTNPEGEKLEEVRSNIIKASITTRLQDSIQQETLVASASGRYNHLTAIDSVPAILIAQTITKTLATMLRIVNMLHMNIVNSAECKVSIISRTAIAPRLA